MPRIGGRILVAAGATLFAGGLLLLWPRFQSALPGGGHYAADHVPERVAELLLDHLARPPV